MSSTSDEDISCTPDSMKMEAEAAINNILPESSKERYLKIYDEFMKWRKEKQNVNKRNEELRRARIEAAEQANSHFYKRYVKRKKQEQQRLMYSARDTIFKNKDAPKMLLSAVIETAIQKERQEQLKFLAERRKEAAEQRRKDDEDVIRKAKEWNELMALRKKRRFEVNKQHQKEILDQAHEIAERNRLEYERELNHQKLDNIKANKEINSIKEFEQNFNAAEKARILSDMQTSREEVRQRARETMARDQLDDQLLAVLGRSRARVDAKRKQTEKETRDEKLRVLEKISQKLESGDAARESKEQAILDKAVKEKEAIAEARRQALEEKQAKFKQERINIRQQYLEEQERQLHEFNNKRQWEIMNRFKNAELYEDFQEKQKEEKERKVKEYREDILKLWKEREDREARELAETRHFYGEEALSKLRAADNRLLAHGDLLLREAVSLGRPQRPLHRALDRYCKMYRLYSLPPLPPSLQEHFTQYAARDGSRPDDRYRPPAAPARDRDQDQDQDQDHEDQDASHTEPQVKAEPAPQDKVNKRDGLQIEMPVQSVLSKPAEDTGNDDDYKKQGRANGLQRRKAQDATCLPPINVVPCRSESCRCDLKK